MFPDSKAYIEFARFILGSGKEYDPFLVIRPGTSALAAALSPLLDISTSYVLLNSIMWIAGVVVVFKLTFLLFENEKQALVASLLYATARPMLYFAGAILSDGVGYFAVGLTVYLTFLRDKGARRGDYLVDAIFCGLLLFMRETHLFALVFMLFHRVQKKKGSIETLVGFAVVGVFIYAYLVAWGFDPITYLSNYRVYHLPTAPKDLGLMVFEWAKAVIRSFSPLVMLIPLGVGDTSFKRIFLCGLFLSPVALIWPTITDRYIFNMYPAAIPLATLGLSRAIAVAQSRLRLSIPQDWMAIIVVLLWALYNSYASLATFGLGYLTLAS